MLKSAIFVCFAAALLFLLYSLILCFLPEFRNGKKKEHLMHVALGYFTASMVMCVTALCLTLLYYRS